MYVYMSSMYELVVCMYVCIYVYKGCYQAIGEGEETRDALSNLSQQRLNQLVSDGECAGDGLCGAIRQRVELLCATSCRIIRSELEDERILLVLLLLLLLLLQLTLLL